MNPTYQPVLTLSLKVNSNISSNRFVKANGQLCGSEQKSIGVTEYNALSGEFAPVIVIGTALVTAAGSINIGDEVTSDSQGRAIKYMGSGNINGYAFSSATSGNIVKILLR